jgi:hypothetical protein
MELKLVGLQKEGESPTRIASRRASSHRIASHRVESWLRRRISTTSASHECVVVCGRVAHPMRMRLHCMHRRRTAGLVGVQHVEDTCTGDCRP